MPILFSACKLFIETSSIYINPVIYLCQWSTKNNLCKSKQMSRHEGTSVLLNSEKQVLPQPTLFLLQDLSNFLSPSVLKDTVILIAKGKYHCTVPAAQTWMDRTRVLFIFAYLSLIRFCMHVEMYLNMHNIFALYNIIAHNYSKLFKLLLSQN